MALAESRFTDHIHGCVTFHARIDRNARSIPAVLDLNHILLFIACISPLVLLAQSWRRGGLNRAWRIAALAVLLVTGAAWIVTPDTAGFLGAGAWLVLMVTPSVGLRKIAELVAQQRYAVAWRLARALRFVHPAKSLREQSDLLRALELAQRGDFAAALALLGRLGNSHTNVGRQAIAQSFRIRGDWGGLLGWRGELPPGIAQTDSGLLPLYLRALGETGARDQLPLVFAASAKSMSASPQHVWLCDVSLLPVLAFCGRLEALSNLLETRLRKLSRDTKDFWIATAEIAAGETMAGRARLEKLRATAGNAFIRADAARRLERASGMAATPLSPAADAMLRRIEQSDRPSTRVFASDAARPTNVVVILIALNVAMFVAECALGGSTNPLTLHQLGALEFFAVRFEGEYWRLLTSLFLHYGPLHLLFNLYALFIIGSGLERSIGSIRFGICYLLSGLGSGIGVLFLRQLGWNKAEQLVGASGCVMGLVGVWAGLLLRRRDGPMAGRRLKNILLIVVVQTAFDLSTPQISMAAHLSGLITGLMLGLILAPRTLRASV
jgi:rhomboid protease GluP